MERKPLTVREMALYELLCTMFEQLRISPAEARNAMQALVNDSIALEGGKITDTGVSLN